MLPPSSIDLLEHAQACCQALTQPAAVVDSRGGVSDMNGPFLELLACEVGGWQGRPIQAFLSHRSASVLSVLKGKLDIPSSYLGADWILHRDDGASLSAALTISTLSNAMQTLYLLMIQKTPRALANVQREFVRRQSISRAARNLALRVLISDVAHEINQPLIAVTLNAQACQRQLLGDAPLSPMLRPTLKQLSNQSMRAGRVIKQIQYGLASSDKGYSQVNLNALLREVTGLWVEESGIYGVQLIPDLAESIPKISGITSDIAVMLHHLIGNALEAMIRVDCAFGHLIRVASSASFGSVEILVEDQGGGMSEEDRAYLMGEADLNFGSPMKLGLLVCRYVIEQHAGELFWKPHPAGRGSQIIARLPTRS